MSRTLVLVAAAGLAGTAAGCSDASDPAPTLTLQAAARGTDRPFAGRCTLQLVHAAHEEDDSGGCGGGGGCGSDDGDHEGGGPPIARRFTVAGSCQLEHLGRTTVSGRLQVTGPFGGGGHAIDAAEGVLAVRGALAFRAANGDNLAARLTPMTASFTPNPAGGGTLQCATSLRIGEAGHDDHETAADDAHEEPVSTGRFLLATGSATMSATFTIAARPGDGQGTGVVSTGRLSY